MLLLRQKRGLVLAVLATASYPSGCAYGVRWSGGPPTSVLATSAAKAAEVFLSTRGGKLVG